MRLLLPTGLEGFCSGDALALFLCPAPGMVESSLYFSASVLAPIEASKPVLLKTLVLRSILLGLLREEPEPCRGDSGSAASSCFLLRHKRKAPARSRATPTIDPTTAPAIVPSETPFSSGCSLVSAPGATTAVLVTVWVTGPPDTVTTRVLTKVVV